MNREFKITSHAKERIEARLNKDPEHVKKLIEDFKAVRITQSRYTSTSAKKKPAEATMYGAGYLFYDFDSDQFFVSVVTDDSNTLITVLTLEQAKKSAFRDSTTASYLAKAVDIFNEDRPREQKLSVLKILGRHAPFEKTFKTVTPTFVTFRNNDGTERRFTCKTTFPKSLFMTDDQGIVHFSWNDPLAIPGISMILEKTKTLGIDASSITKIKIYLGPHGDIEHPNNET